MIEAAGLYIQLISVHGLVRGHNMELGRDSDTGGQIKYVVELARALVEHEAVARVDLLTRKVVDAKVDPEYSQPEEDLGHGAYIIRLPCGPRRYLRKEVLWPYLDSFADAALQHIRRVGRLPDIIHSHYADAGYVGSRLSSLLGLPLVHTGHSLGRDKLRRLLDQGMKQESIERQYHISQRIEGEEMALDNAAFVVASTNQEVEQQYSLYDNYQPRRMIVIPPGVDLQRFRPPKRSRQRLPIQDKVDRFLREPRKPMILALSRPDRRKNISTLIRAYGENKELQEKANLVVVAGSRDDIMAMEKEARRVLAELLFLVDYYDLYGSIAYPKHQQPDDVPALYQVAAKTRGVFVNPALTEPFGLTLLEAAASGLPIVATEDGGPKDIVAHCKNGLLIDPLDADAMGAALLDALDDRKHWLKWSKSGLSGVHRHYSWKAHVNKYMREINKTLSGTKKRRKQPATPSRLATADRLLVCDVDNTLIGDATALEQFLLRLRNAGKNIGFGVATGRGIDSTLKLLKEWKVPMPDLLITSVGTEIYYGPYVTEDPAWRQHNDYRWQPEAVLEAMRSLPGLKLQPKEEQRRHKISYVGDPDEMPSVREIVRHLRKLNLQVNVIFSHQAYLDVVPVRVSKGGAVRHVAVKWGIPVERILAIGDSGNDEEMLRGNTLGVVVGNYSSELEVLRGREQIYFAKGEFSWGILEALDYYDFFGSIRFPEEPDSES